MPAWNQSPLLVGYAQGAIARIVAKLTIDITIYGGEKSYAELDDYLGHRYPDIQYHLRQALTLAILSGQARQQCTQHAFGDPSADGHSSVGLIRKPRSSLRGSRAAM